MVWDLKDGAINEFTISSQDFGLDEHRLELVKGGDAAYNSNMMIDLLEGRLQGPVLDFVLMNSAALLFVAGRVNDLKEGVQVARQSIAGGGAKKALEDFRLVSIN